MEFASAALYVLSYLLAVADGTVQDKGTYPSAPGRIGPKAYARKHPLLVLGAVSGIAATVIAAS